MNEISKKPRIILKNIQSKVWEHPADRLALNSLRSIPALDTVLKAIFGSTTEKSIRLIALASSVRANEKQFSRVYAIHLEACKTLDVNEIPELFISQNPFLNAGAVGMTKPFITLNSATVDILDDEELLGVIAHEVGHIMSGHVLYKTLLQVLLKVSNLVFNIPLTGLALAGLIAALKEWDRKSELSADRAGLLAMQNPDTATKLLMKLTGGNKLDQMDLGEFIKQAEEYRKSESISDSVYKFLNILNASHPFPVVRVLELINWVQTGEYEQILNGNYSTGNKNFYETAKDAAKSYSEDIKNATNPIKDVVDNAKDKFDEASKKAKDAFDNWRKK
ncbi:MAG: M48 family peptidase [Bacteroidetes bacterium]|nr:MAG: M48 family peptidase [Bacteroidota bacterium]